MKQLVQISIVLFVFAALTSVAVADNFDDAMQAYGSGDHEKAHKLFLLEAEKGDKVAQHNLALLYDKGEGVPRDYKEAVKWYRLSAEQGYANSQYNLGAFYYKGKGVPLDYKEAA